MEIEDSGPNPERLAAAIHLQLQHSNGPVPVYEIAKALDVVEIREARMGGLEGPWSRRRTEMSARSLSTADPIPYADGSP